MYKVSTVFSILCMLSMSFISFGMDSSQSLHDADLQTAILSLFTDDDSSVSSQSNAVNTQLHFPDLQSAQVSVFACDELLDSQADAQQQITQRVRPTISMLREIQERYKRNKKQCPIEGCLKFLTRPRRMIDHVAIKHSICLRCKSPLYCDDKKDMKQHFTELHPSADYVAIYAKMACKQCGKKITKGSMTRHLRKACKKRVAAAGIVAYDELLDGDSSEYNAMNTQGLNGADLQRAILSMLTYDGFVAPSQSDAANPQESHLPDLQPTQIGMLACDEIFDGEADNEGMQLSALYGDSMPQHMQVGYDAINTQELNDPDIQAAFLSLFADDDSSAPSRNDAVNAGLHFPDLQSAQTGVLSYDELFDDEADEEEAQPSALYSGSTLQHIQARYRANKKQCPIESCSSLLTRPRYTADHAAAKHKICLLCKPPLYCDDPKDMKQHFKEKHPSRNYATRNKKVACEQCGKEIVVTSIARHEREVCKKRMGSATAATTSDKN